MLRIITSVDATTIRVTSAALPPGRGEFLF